MLRMRMFSLLTALACLAPLAVSAAQVDCGEVYCFRQEDFAGEEMTGICITSLPDPSRGEVLLGSRQLRPGDILTAGQLAQMTFLPRDTEADQVASVTYLPVFSDHVAPEDTVTISIRGKEDLAPAAEDSAGETYKNLPLTASLKVKEPEGQEMTYTLLRNPRRGQVVLNGDGTFTYTPKKNKVGVDSFTYTAADPAGNVSREATVTITILKPTDATQYTDTLGTDCRFAAEWMKNTGIFVGEKLDGKACFQPDKAVTRGEFMTMLVKALDIPTDEEATFTGYTEEMPAWLKPYLAAALRSGLTAGLPMEDSFRPDDPMTCADAAVILGNALELGFPEAPVMAEGTEGDDTLAVLAGRGIFLSGEVLTRGEAALALYEAAQCMNHS